MGFVTVPQDLPAGFVRNSVQAVLGGKTVRLSVIVRSGEPAIHLLVNARKYINMEWSLFSFMQCRMYGSDSWRDGK